MADAKVDRRVKLAVIELVDLVSTGRTLVENALAEQTIISEVSARLIVNRAAFKLRSAEVPALVERFRQAVGDAAA